MEPTRRQIVQSLPAVWLSALTPEKQKSDRIKRLSDELADALHRRHGGKWAKLGDGTKDFVLLRRT